MVQFILKIDQTTLYANHCKESLFTYFKRSCSISVNGKSSVAALVCKID